MKTTIRYPWRENAKNKDISQLKLDAVDTDGVPWKKFRWEVAKYRNHLQVTDYDGSNEQQPESWTEIRMTETYLNSGGKRPVDRTLSITLNSKARRKLIDTLCRAEGIEVSGWGS